ncbi:hemagglutinin repeat-containing protein [Paraburkholderia megapolitana]|uniref:hemagglutinin repeat-containing protein n=1 Tax=Paraburkholderia megapolitana TaxID=420953 RepID=UPI0038BD912B
MNKKTYRLIFSRLRGMLVAVEETATGTGKANRGETTVGQSRPGGHRTTARLALRHVALGVLMLAGVIPVTTPVAHAQIVPGGAHAPSVIQTQNGLPQVNVNRPSGAGVSMNTYGQFDVQKPGAILNNSPAIVNTQQAGYINGNPNFLPGQSASIIVNQVNSNNPSQLRGYVEVAGRRAEVVIANSSGLVVDGGGFINTSRAILTTGSPLIGANGNLTGFNVTGGQITVQGAGLSATSTDQVDLIARAVSANAAIYANTLNVVTGANQVDHDTLATTAIAGSGVAPGVSIDVSQLGGMYANRITLVGTENGVGVSNAGVIAAQAGDLTLTTQGKLVLAGKTNASGNMVLSAHDGLDNNGTTYAQQSVTASTSGALSNSGTLAAQQNLTTNAGSVASTGTLGAGINADGSIAQSGDLAITASGLLSATGHTAAGGNATLTGSALNLANSQTSANGNVTLLASTGDLSLIGATTTAGGALSAQAQGTLTNDHGALSSSGAQTLTAGAVSNQSGQIVSQSTLNVKTGGAVNNRQGIIQAAGSESINTASIDNTAGRVVSLGIGAPGALNITTSGALVNAAGTTGAGTTGGVIGSNGALNVAAGSISNQAQINATGNAIVHAQSLDNHTGSIVAGGSLGTTVGGALNNQNGTLSGSATTVSAASVDDTNGTIEGDQLALSATGNVVNRGGHITQYSNADQRVAAGGTLDNTGGTITSNATNLTVSAQSLTNDSGSIQHAATGTLAVTTTGSMSNTGGKVITNGALTVSGGALSNHGQISAKGNATVTGQSLDNDTGSIAAGGSLGTTVTGALSNQNGLLSATTTTVSAASVDDTNGTIEGNQLSLSATGDVVNRGGHIAQYGSTEQRVSAGGSLDNTGGAITSNATNLTVSAQSFTNDTGSVQHAGAGTLDIAATGAISNTGGKVVTNAALKVTGAAVSNQGLISAKGNATVTAQSLDNHAGSIAAAGNLSATVAGALGNQNGTLSGAATTVSAASVDDTNGTIEGDQLALSTTGNLVNRGGHIQQFGSTDQTVQAGGTLDNTGGTIASNATNLNVSAQAITNDTGSLQHAGTGTLSVTTPGTLSNTGGNLVTNGALKVSGAAVLNQGQISAKGNAAVTAQSLDNHAGSIAAAGNLDATVAGALGNQNGTLSGAATTVSAASVDDTNGTIKGNQLALSSTGNLVNRGGHIQQFGSADQTVSAGGTLDNTGGTIASNATNLNVSAQAITNDTGSLQHAGTGTLTVTTPGALSNAGGQIATNGAFTSQSASLDNTGGTLSAQGAAQVKATTGLTNHGGTLYGKTGLTATTQGTLDNSSGSAQTGGNLSVTAGGALSNVKGTLSANGAHGTTAVAASSIDNTSGKLASSGDGATTITASTGITNSGGTMGGNGNVTLNAQTLANNANANLVAGGAANLNVTRSINNTGGTIYGGTALNLNQSGATVTNDGGKLEGGQDVSVQVASLSNAGGAINANRDIAVSAAASGDGAMTAGRNLSLSVAGDYTNNAANSLHADGNMTVSATGTLTNAGTLAATGALTASGANVVNVAGADINSSSTTVNAAGTLTNAGRIEGNSVTTNSATLANTGTVIGNAVQINATDVRNSGAAAAIAGAQSVKIYASNSVTNSDGALIYSGGNLEIAKDAARDGTGMLADQTGTFTNSASTVQAVGDIDIAAHTVNNLRTGVVTQAGTPQNSGSTTLTLWTAGINGDDLGYYQSQTYPEWRWKAGAIGAETIGALSKPLTVTVPKAQVTSVNGTAQSFALTQPLQDTYIAADSPTVDDCNNVCTNKPVPQTRNITNNATQYYNSITDNGSTYTITFWPDYNPKTNIRPDQVSVRSDLGSDNHDYVEMSRTSTTTTSTDQLLNAGTAATIQAQGAIRVNADGGTINNVSSTMAAGGALTPRANGGVVNETGTVLQQTITADSQSTYFWHQKTGGSTDTKVVDDGITQNTSTVAALPAISTSNGAVGISGQTINVTSVNRLGQTVTGSGVTGGDATGTQLGGVNGQTADVGTATGANGKTAGVTSASGVNGQTAGVNAATGVGGLTTRPQTLGGLSGGVPNLKLPVNGLYSYQTAPGATYLVATDPRLTSYTNFVSSDYMLGQLGLNPQTTEKRLGDGSYEQNLVMNQVTQLTGRTFLAGYSDNMDEYKALMNNGVSYSKEFGLTPGVALSGAQMQQLTTDMVWLVSQTVTLPNGSQQTVLVPTVYLAKSHTVDLQHSGAIVAGNSVSLNATGDVNNSGHIVGDVATTVLGNNIVNSGVIGSGGSTVVAAVQDVRNVSGQIGGVQTVVQAGRDVINETAVASVSNTLHEDGFTSSASSQGTLATGVISATGDAVVLAGRDVNLAGASIQSGNSTFVGAGRNIDIGTTTLTATQDAGTNDGLNGGHTSTTRNVGSTITTGGSLTTVSGGDTTLTDATVKAGGNTNLIAGNNLTVTAATDTQSHHEQSLGGSEAKHTGSSYDETAQGSNVNAGSNLTLGAGQTGTAGALLSQYGVSAASDAPKGAGNLSVLGSSATTGSTQANGTSSGGATTMAATGDINVGAVSETHDSQSWEQVNHSGFLSSDKTTDSASSHQVNSVGSTVSGETVSGAAGHDLTVAGSTVASTGDMALSAGHDLNITTTQDTSQSSHFHEEQKSGLGALGGGGVSVNYGSSDTKDTTHDSSVTQNGSLVGSTNGSVTMTAGNNLHITGSDVIATQDVTGKAANVTVDAATGTSHHDETHETKTSGFTLGLSGSVGDAINNSIQQSQAISSGAGDGRAAALHGIAAAGDAATAAYDASKLVNGAKPGQEPSIGVQLSFGTSQSKSVSSEDQTTQMGSTVKAGGTTSFVATGNGTPGSGNVTIAGSDVSGNNVLLDAKNQVNLVNTTNTDSTRSSNSSSSASVGVSVGTQGVGVSASMSNAHGDANSDAAMQNNTHVTAVNNVSIISGGDTNIVGADVSGNHVAADVGGNLNIASVQDTTVSAAHQSSSGGGFSISQAGGSASFTAQNGHADSNYAGVNEQAGIQAGSGGFDINVKGNTDLKGAEIASTADTSKNSLTTGTLSFSDIQDQSHYSATSNGFSAGVGVGITGKATGPGSVSGSGGVTPMMSQDANGDQSATTKSAISAGTINVTNGAGQTQDVTSLNRDTSNLNGAVSKTPDVNNLLSQQSDMMNAAQAAGQTVSQGIGAYADAKRDAALDAAQTAKDKGDLAAEAAALTEASQWMEGGNSRALLQAGGGALIGGLGGGSVFTAAGGALGAGLSSKLANQTNQLADAISGATGSSLIGNISGNIVAGLGGALLGGSTGAAMASNVDLYNENSDTGDKSAKERLAGFQAQLASDQAAAQTAMNNLAAGVRNGAVDVATGIINLPNGGPLASPGDPGYISLDSLKAPYTSGDQIGANAELLVSILATMGVGKGAAGEAAAEAATAGKVVVIQADLDTLAANGVKFTPKNVIATGTAADGQVVFLETGSSSAGLQHIIEEHGVDFTNKGIAQSDIPSVVMDAVTQGKLVGTNGSAPVYEITYNGTPKYVSVGVSSNGFIVRANPVSTWKPLK